MNTDFRFKNHLLLAALAAAYPVFGQAAPAARIEFAVGNVVAVAGSGQRPLSRGSELNSGETINTGDGRAQLRFADGAMMSLQPQTEFRIDDYNYSGKNDGQEKGFFSLLRGGLRTISGYIGRGNRDAYKVTTSVATIGIRGTEWSGNLTPGATPDDTALDIATGEGAIEVCNASGCIIVASGESAVIVGSSQPRRTDVRPNLPPAGVSNPPPEPAPFTPTEERNPDGTLPIIVGATEPKTQFLTGSNYIAIASVIAEWDGPMMTSVPDYAAPATVTFTDGKATAMPLLSDDWHAPASVLEVTTLSENGIDAVLGWGRWVGGQTGDTTPINALHYVVGVPTSNAQIATLTGVYNYDLTGATTPTWTDGSVTGTGTLNSASLYVNFNGGAGYKADLNVSVTANGSVIAINGTGANSTTSYFTGTGFGASSSLKYSGMLAGTNAKFAGIVYQVNDGMGTDAHGALGFTKGAPVPQ